MSSSRWLKTVKRWLFMDVRGLLIPQGIDYFLSRLRGKLKNFEARYELRLQNKSFEALTPQYIESQHGVYLSKLFQAVEEPRHNKVRNIALAGSYGSGKSSILGRLAELLGRKAVTLSLLNLWRDGVDGEFGNKPEINRRNEANLIQKEIVRQLLYSHRAKHNKDSRFRRIEPFNLPKTIAVSLVWGCFATFFIYIFGVVENVEPLTKLFLELLGSPHDAEDWSTFSLLWAMISIGIFLLLLLYQGRIHITQISAAGHGATISNTDKSTSYFDQYLDEIVYFFESQKVSVVIFEDIDRFNNHYIFEELRALNELLNGVRKSRPVQFIYAVKDSIFDPEPHDGKESISSTNSERAENRTKFFDLIIPVVPFITHQNARDLMKQNLGDMGHEISPQLVDLAAKHFPDMRLIKNIRNEYEVFYSQIISSNEQLKLNGDLLFAMMMYKSVHMADFEKIKVGESALDKVYEAYRRIVNQNRRRLTSEISTRELRIRTLDSIENRVDELNEKLDAYARKAVQISPPHFNGVASISIRPNRERLSGFLALTRDFWKETIEQQKPVEFTVWDTGNNSPSILKFTYKNLTELLGLPRDINEWESFDKQVLTKQIEDFSTRRESLRSIDFRSLLEATEYTFVEQGEEQGHTFSEYAKKQLSQLGYDLLEGGFITREYSDYTTQFYAVSLSATAKRFLTHHIDRGVPDYSFVLTHDDVQALIRERGEDILERHEMYNHDVLNTLFEKSMPEIRVLLGALCPLGVEERDFLVEYLKTSDYKITLVSRLVAYSSGLIPFLVEYFEGETVCNPPEK